MIAECRWGIARCEYQQEEYDDAIELFENVKDVFLRFQDSRSVECNFYIARAYQSDKKYNRAIEIFSQVIDPYHKSSNLNMLANVYYNLGVCYYNSEDYKQAIAPFDSAHKYFHLVSDSEMLAFSFKLKGYGYYYENEWENAATSFETAANWFLKVNDRNNFIECQKMAGLSGFEAKNYEKAIQILSAVARESDPLNKAECSYYIGKAYAGMESYISAVSQFDTAGYFYSSQQKYQKAGNSYFEKGKCLANIEKQLKAAEAYIASAQAYHKVPNQMDEADAYYYAGNNFYNAEKYQSGVENYNSALKLFIFLKDSLGAAKCTMNIADAYNSLELYREALIRYKEAVTKFQELQIPDIKNQAHCLYQSGICLFNLKNYNQAITEFRSAKQKYTNLKQNCDVARCANEIGDAFLKQRGLTNQAVTSYKSSLQVCDEPSIRASAFSGLGDAYLALEPPDTLQAETSYENAASLTGDLFLKANSLEGLAEVNTLRKQLENAADFYLQAAGIYLKIDQRDNEARCRMNAGVQYFNGEYYKKADSLFVVAIKIFSDQDNPNGIAKCNLSLGDCSLKLNDLVKAREFYYLAYQYYKQKPDCEKETAECLTGFGDIYIEQFSYSEAISQYLDALNFANKLDAPLFRANIHFKLASGYSKNNDYEKAISRLKIANNIYSENNNFEGRFICIRSEGELYRERGDFQNSIQKYRLAKQIADSCKSKKFYVTVRIDLGILFYEIGLLDSAITYFTEGKNIAVSDAYPLKLAACNVGIANIEYDHNNHDLALSLYKESLQIYKKHDKLLNIGTCLLNIGNVFKQDIKLQKAEDYYYQAQELYTRFHYDVGIGISWNNLGSLDITNGYYTGALVKLQTAQRVIESTFIRKLLVSVFYNQGVAFESLNQYQNAYQAYANAIDIAERSRAKLKEEKLLMGFIQSRADLYDKIISLLFERLNQPAKALSYLERSRSKNIVDEFERIYAEKNPDFAKIKQDLLELHNKFIKQQIESLDVESSPSVKKALASTWAEILILEKKLQAEKDRNSIPSLSVLNLKQLQSLLPDTVKLVWYYPAQSKLYVILLSNKEQKMEQISVSRDSLYANIKKYNAWMNEQIQMASNLRQLPRIFSWKDPNIEPMLRISEKLYDYLIGGIEPYLADEDLVFFIPAGLIHYIPIHALSKKNSNGIPEFVIEKWKVAYLSSTPLLQNLIKQGRKPALTKAERLSRTYVFANPDGTLPGSEKGAEIIRSIIEKETRPARIFKREAATEKQAMTSMPECWMFVFSTHSNANSQDPDSSFILLSPSTNHDGILYSSEIKLLYGKYLDIVVLPNCGTALGEENPGKEVRSLSQSFFIAGASSVLGTLWSVSDNSTFQLMKEFYTNFLENDINKFNSLRMAQLSLLRTREFRHPFCWAGFVLFGFWE